MDHPRAILHVDMDAFFAAVEVLDNPELAGKAVIVGGRPESRGVVAAASYEARACGVHSAMPSATAGKLCPHGIFLPPRGRRYAEISRAVMAVLAQYTPLVEQISVDEAFLDVSGGIRAFGEAEVLARRIKRHIREETKLTASIGVAPNKFLAKLASDLDKPDGLTVIAPGSEAERIAPLEVRRIWGVGPRAAEKLERIGIRTIGQLAAHPPGSLERHIGDHAAHLQALARGEDEREVITARPVKSISRETTFAEFLTKADDVERVLLGLSEDVAARLRRKGLAARTVTLKVRDERFRTVTRAVTLDEPVNLAEQIYEASRILFAEKIDLSGRKVRLLGVAAGNLAPWTGDEPSLFPDEEKIKRRQLAEAMDKVREKFGADAITRARLVNGDGLSERAGWEGAPRED